MPVPAERRRYQRHETELPARIGTDGVSLRDCVVRDYCSGGMLVELRPADPGQADAGFAPGQGVQLDLQLLDKGGRRRMRIDATVAWVKSGYLGLSFPTSSQAIVSALQQHDRLVRANAAQAPRAQQGGEARCLAKLRHVAQGFLPGLLREILIKTCDDLLEVLDKGVPDAQRQQIYADISALEEVRAGDGLLRSILAYALERSAVAPDARDAGELALVDREDFERWLEASRVANLLEQKFARQLSALASRLGTVRDAEEAGSLSVPFEPHHFTEALKDLAQLQRLGATSRGVLFDRTARLLRDKLGDLYQALDAALDALGIAGAQHDKNVVILRPGKPHRQPDVAPVDGVASESRSSTSAARPGAEQVVVSGQGQHVTIDPELLKVLQLREAKQRESQAQELLSFVGEMPNMTGSLAAWLEQLNGLLVREAVADRTFFHNSEHPLREIVDGLGHLQMFRRRPDLALADDPLQQRVTEVLEPVRHEQVDETTLRAVATSLGTLIDEQSRLYQRNVERVAEASEGRDRLRQAREAVVAELNRRYAGRQIPAVVPELLEVGWRAVLELALLGARGADRYQGLLQTLNRLIRQLGGEAVEDGMDPIDPMELLACIENELATVSFDPFRRTAVESRLRAELINPGSKPVELVTHSALGARTEEKGTDTPPAGIAESAWRQALGQCATIKVGDQLQLLDAPDDGQELRVAWIRADRGLYTLIDYRGLRVRDISLYDLALGFYRRRIKLDRADGRPLSERAVDAMLSRMEARVDHQAAHDSLTGLINRQQFNAALARALAMPDRAADAGVLLWIDVDQFRLVNDIYGYDTGDRLLIAVARQLDQVKGAKVLAHLGSDRFAVLLPDIAPSSGERRAAGICDAVRRLVFEWPGQGMNLSVSIGVVSLEQGAEGVSGLLRSADAALAQAKSAGGDQAYTYRADDPGITQRNESVQWVVRVDEALDHGALKLRCQPIVPIRSDEGLKPHYEVLLGVRSGSNESLPIAEFIDAAERYNRMRAVDRWVVRTTMAWIDAHREHMSALHGFAVNLSGQTASDSTFVDFVRGQFQQTRVDPAWLSFEITETAAVSDLSRTAGIIHELKAMGCMVALDDFGSGLASYSYLKELPVDWLKIDGAFVRKIAADPEDLAVVKSINEIGHFLGKKTIAEYVADDHILRLISEIGVDYAQGYRISPPLLMDDLIATLGAG